MAAAKKRKIKWKRVGSEWRAGNLVVKRDGYGSGWVLYYPIKSVYATEKGALAAAQRVVDGMLRITEPSHAK